MVEVGFGFGHGHELEAAMFGFSATPDEPLSRGPRGPRIPRRCYSAGQAKSTKNLAPEPKGVRKNRVQIHVQGA